MPVDLFKKEGIQFKKGRDLFKENNISYKKPVNNENQDVKKSLFDKSVDAADYFNKSVERGIVEPSLGAIQGFMNIPSGLANIPIKTANYLSSSHIPEAPYWDVAPHTIPSQIGELLSMGPGLNKLRAASELGSKFISPAMSNISKNPMIERGIENAKNIFAKLPISSGTAKNVGEGAILGAVYSHDDPLLGAALGGSIPVAGKLYSSAKKLMYKPDIKNIGKQIQESYDSLNNDAINMFKKVEQEAYSRGVSNVPIEKKLFDKIKKTIKNRPDTLNDTIEKAESGDYKNLRKLQTELFERGTFSRKSDRQSERDIGRILLELRDKINSSISSHLKDTGNLDLKNILDTARDRYRTLKDTYYGEKTPSYIKNLVHSGSRKIPKNLMNFLSEDSIPSNKIIKENPFLIKHIKSNSYKQNALNKLKYLGKASGVATAAAAGASVPTLYNKSKELANKMIE